MIMCSDQVFIADVSWAQTNYGTLTLSCSVFYDYQITVWKSHQLTLATGSLRNKSP